MRAVIMRRFGPPSVLEPAVVASPGPDAGEVAIDVEFAGVTFVETQIRAGRPPRREMLPALPSILGNGVGGTVAEAGDGVDRGLVGRQVIASLNGTGGYASRAVTDAARLLELPGELPLRHAVALLADGRTAVSLTDLAGPRSGRYRAGRSGGGRSGDAAGPARAQCWRPGRRPRPRRAEARDRA